MKTRIHHPSKHDSLFLVLALAILAAMSAGSVHSQIVGNGGFEIPVLPVNGHQYDPAGGIWTFNGRSGVINPNIVFDAPAAPEGLQIGFLQYQTSSGEISQTLTLAGGGSFTLNYRVAGRRSGAYYDGNLVYVITLDNQQIATDTTVSSQGWTQKTLQFTASGGSHNLAFKATSTASGGTPFVDHTAFLDAVSITPISVGCVPAPSDLVAWWPSDGDANDIRGNNNGTLQGGVTFVPGFVGQAFSFDGVADFVSIPNQDRNTFTFATWVKRDRLSVPSRDRLIVSLGDDGWGVLLDADNTIALTKVGVGGVNSAGTVDDTNGWHHVTVTYANSEARFYIDGVLDVVRSYGVSFSSGSGYTIGSRGNNEFFKGLLDEVVIFSRALSSNEVAAIYAAGNPGMCKAGRNPPQLTGLSLLGNGSFRFGFTNVNSGTFTAFAATNPSLPSSNWTVLGPVTESTPGQYQFTDSAATNFPYRFYQIRSP